MYTKPSFKVFFGWPVVSLEKIEQAQMELVGVGTGHANEQNPLTFSFSSSLLLVVLSKPCLSGNSTKRELPLPLSGQLPLKSPPSPPKTEK